MTQLTTIDTNNYAAMAKAMGIANEGTSSSSSSLARMRISHSPIMGTAEVKGKNVNVEVVEGGTYKLDIPDGPTYFSPNVKFRPFMQRFMYKRFVKGTDSSPNKYIKTLMSDNLNLDLKDTEGGFNCGKPAGYIKDFKALPEKTQELIRQIKRVRVVFGTVEMLQAVNEQGEEAEVGITPFIWEIDNRDAFKEVGGSFETLAKMQRLPIQHTITANTQERKIPTGASFYVPQVSLDLTNTVQLTDEDQNLFGDFMGWIDNYNNYVLNSWSEKTNSKMEEEDEEVVEGLVDIEIEED